jgi:hypothetical protein
MTEIMLSGSGQKTEPMKLKTGKFCEKPARDVKAGLFETKK